MGGLRNAESLSDFLNPYLEGCSFFFCFERAMMPVNRYIIFVLCLVVLAGCSSPKRSSVVPPPQRPTQSKNPLTVSAQVPDRAKTAVEPGLVDIRGREGLQDKDEIQREMQQPSAVGETSIQYPSEAYVNQRIFAYGQKLEVWKALDKAAAGTLDERQAMAMVQCFKELQQVLNGYNAVKTYMVQNGGSPDFDTANTTQILQLQAADVAFMETACGQQLSAHGAASGTELKAEPSADVRRFEEAVAEYYRNQRFDELVDLWRQIPQVLQAEMPVSSRLKYAKALVSLHSLDRALEAYEEVVSQLKHLRAQGVDILGIQRELADLYVISGDRDSAKPVYAEIDSEIAGMQGLSSWSATQLSFLDRPPVGSSEGDDYLSLLKDYIAFSPAQHGYKTLWLADEFLNKYPQSPVASNVAYIRDSSKKTADLWFNSRMEDVDALSEAGKYQEALELLSQISAESFNTNMQLRVIRKKNELGVSAAVLKETDKMAMMQELQHKWNNGMLLAKGERYEEAIDVFSSLFETEYDAKAKNKVNELRLLAAEHGVKKSAKLFRQYLNTSDQQTKLQLLVETRQTLLDLLTRYPETAVVPKAKGYIERVEQEMSLLDPDLLLQLQQQNVQEPPAGTVSGW
ncbi:MAG: hypothetical protein CSA20_03755 [Deltaproteobacteria bacterium]|nr:MAG: hypothetical protein CSA20_03755 [Deltaproteobacteria bacterium]